jgi:mannosyltransferase OCH1-like enzyme
MKITKTTPYPLKINTNNPLIPLNVYQTWNTKKLPLKMNERREILKKENPEFTFHLFDNNDCQQFIKNHFTVDVLNAYNTLIPGAYKADLWRCCVLYVYGGIYMDIKLLTVNNFKLIELTSKEHFVKDRPLNSIYNAFMVCKPYNILLKRTIIMITINVKQKYYGLSPLDPTGPLLMGKLANNQKNVNIDLIHHNDGGFLTYKKYFVISTEYPEYNKERTKTYEKLRTYRYDVLWHNRRIYTSLIKNFTRPVYRILIDIPCETLVEDTVYEPDIFDSEPKNL